MKPKAEIHRNREFKEFREFMEVMDIVLVAAAVFVGGMVGGAAGAWIGLKIYKVWNKELKK